MMTQILFFRLLFSLMVAVDMIILHALIVIIFIPFVKSSQELFRNHSEGITWDRAQDACNPHGLENREEFLRKSGIPDEHEFWIGKVFYRVKTRSIEIIDYNGLVRQSSDPGNCTTICCGTCNGINSNHLEERRCSSVDTTIVGRCGTQQNSGFKWDLDYYGSLNYCMHRNRLLLSSDYCQIQDTEAPYQGQISWTNVFREEVEIIRTQDFSEDPDRCVSGVFTIVQGQRTLHTTEQNCNETKYWYICKTNRTVYNMYTTESSLVNTKPGLGKINRDQDTITASTVAVIGGVLGACFILTVSTVMIVCKIRSKGMFRESNTRDYEDIHLENIQQTTYEGLDNTNETSLTATPNQTSVIDDFSAPVYEGMNQSER